MVPGGSIPSSQGTGSRSPGSAGTKNNQGDVNSNDGGDPKIVFQMDPRDGHPLGVPPVDVPCDMSSSQASWVVQPIMRAMERAFLGGSMNNRWAALFRVKPT